MKRLKRRGMTAWVEDENGEHVPVKGAMRRPASLEENPVDPNDQHFLNYWTRELDRAAVTLDFADREDRERFQRYARELLRNLSLKQLKMIAQHLRVSSGLRSKRSSMESIANAWMDQRRQNPSRSHRTRRAQYVLDNYRLEPYEGGWRALMSWPGGKWQVIEGANRTEVVNKARSHWGHFNFQDEAEAFDEIFPLGLGGGYDRSQVRGPFQVDPRQPNPPYSVQAGEPRGWEENPSGSGDLIERESFYMPPHGPAHLLRAKPVNPDRLTKAQRRVLNEVAGTETGFVANAAFYARPFRRLSKTDHRILISLLLGGALEQWKVRGPLPGEHSPSEVGAHADYHFLFAKPHQVMMARGPDGFTTEGWEYRPNPPYSGYVKDWWEKPHPKDEDRIAYQTKTDALNVFADHNRGIIDDYGGEGMVHSPESFEAINHQEGLKGKRRVNTIARALWWALPSGGPPWYLEDIDVELLNRTAPAIYNQRGLSFHLPDFAEQERLLREEEAYNMERWEERQEHWPDEGDDVEDEDEDEDLFDIF